MVSLVRALTQLLTLPPDSASTICALNASSRHSIAALARLVRIHLEATEGAVLEAEQGVELSVRGLPGR
eukprot:48488-Eustigmatos_ZCMA.PRE.1